LNVDEDAEMPLNIEPVAETVDAGGTATCEVADVGVNG